MKTIYFIPAFALLVAPVSASAADAVFQHDVAPVAPIAVPVHKNYDWNGAYVGATVGGVFSKTPGLNSLKDGSLTGGVYTGYNYQDDNNWVLGVEGDANIAKQRKDAVSPKYYGAVRARAGYALDRFLPYVDGGAVVGKLASDAPNGEDESHTHFGYTLGAGLEYAVTDNLTTRISYHYVNFNKHDYTINGVTESVGPEAHVIGAGLSLKF